MFARIMTASVVVAICGLATAQPPAKPAPAPAGKPAATQPATAKPADKPAEKMAEKPAKPSAAQPQFDQLKKMAGVWQGAKDKDGNQATAIYRITSGGSAVSEILMPGTPHEMLGVYTLDGDSILYTHYCAVGNQPRMKLKAGGTTNVLAFDFKDAGGMKSDKDGHMHSLTITFKDDDHIAAAWQYYTDGKPSAEHAPVFEMARVKDADAAAKVIAAAATSCCAGNDGAACCDSGVKAEKTGGKN